MKNEINNFNNEKKSIKLNNKEIGSTGMAWLKLLSLRHWATTDDSLGAKRYIIPGDISDLPEEIQSAITILQFINNDDLKSYIRYEERALVKYNDIWNDGKNEDVMEEKINSFLNHENDSKKFRYGYD